MMYSEISFAGFRLDDSESSPKYADATPLQEMVYESLSLDMFVEE